MPLASAILSTYALNSGSPSTLLAWSVLLNRNGMLNSPKREIDADKEVGRIFA